MSARVHGGHGLVTTSKPKSSPGNPSTTRRRRSVGGTKPAIVLQGRDHALLREVHQLRVIDREDARALVGFQSRTRANTRLLALVRAGLLTRTPAGTVRGGHKFL